MKPIEWQPGDWVIYRKQKHSKAPGPRAKAVRPASSGDRYAYVVDKYWIVDRSLEDGTLLLKTRRGKEHTVPVDDPNLRRPSWWERWLFAYRFSRVEKGPETG